MERSSTSGSSGSAQASPVAKVSSPVAVPPPTIFVQAEPHTFRDLVQKHTGAPAGDAPDKLPVTAPPQPPARSPAVGPRRAAFKLQERRPSVRKLEIKLGLTSLHHHHHPVQPSPRSPPSTPGQQQYLQQLVAGAAGGAKAAVAASFPSPVTPLVSGPVFSPPPGASEEERAIAEKGFYLHPSPRGTPRGSDPPELLPLFPLTSPKLLSRRPSTGDGAADREAERKQL